NHDDVGPVRGETLPERVPDILGGDAAGWHAEGLGELHEVRAGELGGRCLAEGVHHVFAQDAVAAVVYDQPRDRDVVLPGGGQLGDRVHGGTIPGDCEHAAGLADGFQTYCSADGRREAVAEAAGALGRVELALSGVPAAP